MALRLFLTPHAAPYVPAAVAARFVSAAAEQEPLMLPEPLRTTLAVCSLWIAALCSDLHSAAASELAHWLARLLLRAVSSAEEHAVADALLR